MRILYDFGNADPGENEIYAFDFVSDLNSGEAISSAAWEIGLVSGSDGTPSTRLIGSPAVNGTKIEQRIANLQPGAVYRFRAIATTSAGNVKSLWTHVTCNILA